VRREDLAGAVASAGVRDPRLLEALRAVPRSGFVPPDVAQVAHLDRPLPIPHGQVTTQPSLSAKMIEERFPDLAAAARENLDRQGVDNVEVVVGDGTEGLQGQAPYDAILVSAAFTSVPPPLVRQLSEGGRLVQPIGSGGEEEVILFEKTEGDLVRRRTVTGAHFVRLYGAHAFQGR
jgi:protein-L-isoaspartate(D-aspartate) O-methyltransferase